MKALLLLCLAMPMPAFAAGSHISTPRRGDHSAHNRTPSEHHDRTAARERLHVLNGRHGRRTTPQTPQQ